MNKQEIVAPSERGNKNRLLFLLKYLIENTDAEHRLSTTDALTLYEANGCGKKTRKTLYDDIQCLVAEGYAIETESGTQNSYYYDGRPFQRPELKMLMDAVYSAAFINERETQILIEKIAHLGSKTETKELIDIPAVTGMAKADNSKLLYITDAIQQAISANRKIRFQYYEYDINKNRVLRHDGEYYYFSPYCTYCENGKYYMIGFLDKRQAINPFRVELMGMPEILDEPAVPQPDDFNLNEYIGRTFKMYGGDQKKVSLEVEESLMKKIIDKFGSDFECHVLGNQKFQADVDVAVSPTFYGWVFQYDGKINIIGPEDVRTQYEDMLRRMLIYTEKLSVKQKESSKAGASLETDIHDVD